GWGHQRGDASNHYRSIIRRPPFSWRRTDWQTDPDVHRRKRRPRISNHRWHRSALEGLRFRRSYCSTTGVPADGATAVYSPGRLAPNFTLTKIIRTANSRDRGVAGSGTTCIRVQDHAGTCGRNMGDPTVD